MSSSSLKEALVSTANTSVEHEGTRHQSYKRDPAFLTNSANLGVKLLTYVFTALISIIPLTINTKLEFYGVLGGSIYFGALVIAGILHLSIFSYTVPVFANWKQFIMLLAFIPLLGVGVFSPAAATSFALNVTGCVITFILMLVAIALEIIIPNPVAIRTTGIYEVSTTAAVWSYVNPNTNEKEDLSVQIWYPAAAANASNSGSKQKQTISSKRGYADRALLWTTGRNEQKELDGLLDALLGSTPLRSNLFLQQAHSLRTNALKDHDIHCGKHFPLVIMCHGLYGWKGCHSYISEELASHGYIVVAKDHAPDNMATIFPSPDINDKPHDYRLPSHINKATPEEREFYKHQLQNRCAQIQCCIDNMTASAAAGFNSSEKDSNDLVTYDADLVNSIKAAVSYASEIGIVGHSYGGASVVQTALSDKRVKAMVGLDTWMYPLSDQHRDGDGVHNPPMLFISGDAWQFHSFQAPFRETNAKRNPHSRVLRVRGGKHMQFNDCAFLFGERNLAKADQVGSGIDFMTSYSLIAAYTVQHMNKFLKHDENVVEVSFYDEAGAVEMTALPPPLDRKSTLTPQVLENIGNAVMRSSLSSRGVNCGDNGSVMLDTLAKNFIYEVDVHS